jgi:hypothetical protein
VKASSFHSSLAFLAEWRQSLNHKQAQFEVNCIFRK